MLGDDYRLLAEVRHFDPKTRFRLIAVIQLSAVNDDRRAK
jgi:hypothetical protein